MLLDVKLFISPQRHNRQGEMLPYRGTDRLTNWRISIPGLDWDQKFHRPGAGNPEFTTSGNLSVDLRSEMRTKSNFPAELLDIDAPSGTGENQTGL